MIQTSAVVCDGDGSRAVGIGGIMGGAETEISFSTKNVLIECAWFDPIAVRRCRALPEASHRSQHALWTRRRSGNGRSRLAPGGGVDPATRRRRTSLRRRRCLSGKTPGKENHHHSRGIPPHHGRRRSRQRSRSHSFFALGFAPVRVDHNPRRRQFATRRVGMHATFLARRRRAGDRSHRRSRACLRHGQISSALARGAIRRGSLCRIRKRRPVCANG